jgi:hypothetical protein
MNVTPQRKLDNNRRWRERNKKRLLEAHRRYRASHRDAKRAHCKVFRALRSGRLVRPENCQGCHEPSPVLHGHHHRGYEPAHALDVQWLCPACHARAEKL